MHRDENPTDDRPACPEGDGQARRGDDAVHLHNLRYLLEEILLTATHVVEATQYIAFGQVIRTLGEYVDWLADHVERLEEAPLMDGGTIDEEYAPPWLRRCSRASCGESVTHSNVKNHILTIEVTHAIL